MHWLEKRLPPLLLVLLAALLMWGLAGISPRLALDWGGRPVIALLLMLLGSSCCLSGVLAFRRAQTTVNPLQPDQASALVSSGIYARTRNPMYLGFALWLLAWAVWLAAPLALLGLVLFVLWMNRFQIQAEERALQALFGEAFADYCRRVRRWL